MSFAMGKSSNTFIFPTRKEVHTTKTPQGKKPSGINTNGVATVSIKEDLKTEEKSLTELMDTLDTIKPNHKTTELLINPNTKISYTDGDVRVAVVPCNNFPSKIEIIVESEDATVLCTLVDLYTNDIVHSFTKDLDIANFVTNVTFTNKENIVCPVTVLALNCKLIKTNQEQEQEPDDIEEEINTESKVLAVKFTM